jgi:hypothetical protein
LFGKRLEERSRFLLARIVAVVLMISSIVAWLLQPTQASKKETAGIILLTKNYDRAKADSLVKKYPKLTILRLNDAVDFENVSMLSRLMNCLITNLRLLLF